MTRIVHVIDDTVHPFNVKDTPLTVNVLATTREYDLSGVRKVYEPIAYVNSSGQEEAGPRIIDYASRFARRSTCSWRDGCYLIRQSDDTMVLGFPASPAEAFTLHVYYAPTITALVADGDVPTQIPPDHHLIIAVRAALDVLIKQRRDTTLLLGQYNDLMSALNAHLGPGHRHRGVRFL